MGLFGPKNGIFDKLPSPQKIPLRVIWAKKWRKQSTPKVAILRRYTPSGEFAWIPFAYKMGWRTKNYKYHVCRRVLSWIPWSSSPCCEPCMCCMSSLPRIAQVVFQQRFLRYPPTNVVWHFSYHVLNWSKGKLCSQIREALLKKKCFLSGIAR